MYFIDSLRLFFFSSDSSQLLAQGLLDFGVILFFSLNGFLLFCLLFLYPATNTLTFSQKWWVALVNGITLSSGFSVMQWGYLLAQSRFEGQGMLVDHLFFAWFLSTIAGLILWRFMLGVEQSKLKTFCVGSLFAVIFNLQMLVSIAGINGVAIAYLNTGQFYLSLMFTACFFSAALWLKLTGNYTLAWQGKMTIVLGSAALIMLAVFYNLLTINDVYIFSWQFERINNRALFEDVLFQALVIDTIAMLLLCLMGQKTLKLLLHLEHEKQKYRNMTNFNNGIIDAIIAFDAKGIILFYNHAAEKLFGWQKNEMLGRDILRLISDEHKDFFTLYIKRSISQKMPAVLGMQQEFMVKNKQGNSFPARLAIGSYQNEKKMCFSITIANIRELRGQIDSQREHVREYQSLISNLPCVTFRESSEAPAHWVFVSDNAKVQTGLSAIELQSEMGAAQFMNSIFPEDLELYQQAREKAKQNLGRYEVKFRYLLKDNQVRHFWEIGYCYRIKDSSLWRDGVIVDISNQKQQAGIAENGNTDFVFSALKKHQFENRLQSISQLINASLQLQPNEATTHYLQQMQRVNNELKTAIESKRQDDISPPLEEANQPVNLSVLSQRIYNCICDIALEKQITCRYQFEEQLANHSFENEEDVTQLCLRLFQLINFVQKGSLVLSFYARQTGIRIALEFYTIKKIKKDRIAQDLKAIDTQTLSQPKARLWGDLHAFGGVLYADLELISQQTDNALLNKPTILSSQEHALILDESEWHQKEFQPILWQHGIHLAAISDIDLLKNSLHQQPFDLLFIDWNLCQNVNIQKIREWAQKEIRIIALVFSLDVTKQDLWRTQGFDAVLNKPINASEINTMLLSLANIGWQEAENQEKESLIFDHCYLYQRLPSFDLIFWFAKAFTHNFGHLAKIEKDDLTQLPISYFEQAKEAAFCLGFIRLNAILQQSIQLISQKADNKFTLQCQMIRACYSDSIEAVLASLGIREKSIKNASSSLTSQEFEQKLKVFDLKLTQAIFDQDTFNSLLPELVMRFPLPSLAALLDLIQMGDFNQAHHSLDELLKTLLNKNECKPTYAEFALKK